MSEPLRQVVFVLLATFLLVQGMVVLQLLLVVQRYLLPETLGPEVGRWIPRIPFQTIDGRPLVLGGNGRASVLLFVGPACGACRAMMPAFQQLVRENHQVDFVFFGVGDEPRNREYAAEIRPGIADAAYVVLPLPRVRVEEFGVRSVPYLIVLDMFGVVVARGYVPSREKMDQVVVSAGEGLRSPIAMPVVSASESRESQVLPRLMSSK